MRGRTPVDSIEDKCIDGKSCKNRPRGKWSANSAPKVTGHGGHHKMGGFTRTCWPWMLVDSSLTAARGAGTWTEGDAIFTFHRAFRGEPNVEF